jgi:hypothetical protein
VSIWHAADHYGQMTEYRRENGIERRRDALRHQRWDQQTSSFTRFLLLHVFVQL